MNDLEYVENYTTTDSPAAVRIRGLKKGGTVHFTVLPDESVVGNTINEKAQLDTYEDRVIKELEYYYGSPEVHGKTFTFFGSKEPELSVIVVLDVTNGIQYWYVVKW